MCVALLFQEIIWCNVQPGYHAALYGSNYKGYLTVFKCSCVLHYSWNVFWQAHIWYICNYLETVGLDAKWLWCRTTKPVPFLSVSRMRLMCIIYHIIWADKNIKLESRLPYRCIRLQTLKPDNDCKNQILVDITDIQYRWWAHFRVRASLQIQLKNC